MAKRARLGLLGLAAAALVTAGLPSVAARARAQEMIACTAASLKDAPRRVPKVTAVPSRILQAKTMFEAPRFLTGPSQD